MSRVNELGRLVEVREIDLHGTVLSRLEIFRASEGREPAYYGRLWELDMFDLKPSKCDMEAASHRVWTDATSSLLRDEAVMLGASPDQIGEQVLAHLRRWYP